MEKYTIEDGSKGKVAIKNDGTVEQLQELLILMFPSDKSHLRFGPSTGGSSFYYLSDYADGLWSCSNKTDLPTQSVKDFLEAEWTPKMGDTVLVRDNEKGAWGERVFVAKRDGCSNSFITICSGDEPSFLKGNGFLANTWAEMKQLPPEEPKEPKIEFSVMVNGQETKLSLEKSEWDKLMSLNERI